MSFYDRHILPFLIDRACAAPQVRRQRELIVPEAEGRVLEIGIGSGLNLPYYDRSRVDHIFGLDVSPELMFRAHQRAEKTGVAFEPLILDAATIPLDDAAVDTVLVTYTLCSIPALQQALSEMRRVLKPGGRLLFSEHGAAPDPGVLKWQRRLTPLWKRIAGGCHLDRDAPAEIARAGFRIAALDQGYLPAAPRFVGYNSRGVALKS